MPGIAPKRRRGPWLGRVLLFFTSVLVVEALIGTGGLTERLHARRTLTEGRQELSALRRSNAALRDEVRRLREDPVAIEAVARRELGLLRRDEVLFFVRQPSR
jgi:cell division protein FtsB